MSRVFRIRVIKDSFEDVKSYFNTITFFSSFEINVKYQVFCIQFKYDINILFNNTFIFNFFGIMFIPNYEGRCRFLEISFYSK